MARRRIHDEDDNHERWLVSYADFITLLFAFFVVMYAMSTVNEGKYRVLSETLSESFVKDRQQERGMPIGIESGGAIIAKPEQGIEIEHPIQSEDPITEVLSPPDPEEIVPSEAKKEESIAPPQSQPQSSTQQRESAELSDIAQRLKDQLDNLILEDLAEVTYNERWVEVNLNSQMLFETGESRLSRPALSALRDVSRVLKTLPNAVNVEGYTDNVPIRTQEFPSNWELSSARAASVVHYFARLGVDPQRLAAVGFGEFRPIADNSTPLGRAKNRRVTLLIMSAKEGGGSRGSARDSQVDVP